MLLYHCEHAFQVGSLLLTTSSYVASEACEYEGSIHNCHLDMKPFGFIEEKKMGD